MKTFALAVIILAIWMLPLTIGIVVGARKAHPETLIIVPMLTEPARSLALEAV